MINLNNFIIEKLKISSNTKINSYDDITNQIIVFLYNNPEEASKEEIDIISNWVESNKIKFITVITTKNVLEAYGLIDRYNNVSLEDVKDMFETENFKIQIIHQSLYDQYTNHLGKLKWKDKYDYARIYINDDKKNNDGSLLTFQSYSAGNILFYPKYETTE